MRFIINLEIAAGLDGFSDFQRDFLVNSRPWARSGDKPLSLKDGVHIRLNPTNLTARQEGKDLVPDYLKRLALEFQPGAVQMSDPKLDSRHLFRRYREKLPQLAAGYAPTFAALAVKPCFCIRELVLQRPEHSLGGPERDLVAADHVV